MGGATTPQLATAVSRAGGLGMLEHASLIPLADRIAELEQAHTSDHRPWPGGARPWLQRRPWHHGAVEFGL